MPTSDCFFRKLCDATRGDPERPVHCLHDVADPLGWEAEKTWDAVDELLSDGLIRSAQESGLHVRLTAAGVQRCSEDQHRSVD